MYPRNAASPEPIAIGAVIQISDGAVQTSGCTVRIKPIGVAEGDGAGATAYSTDGIVLYTPTQAETNYTSFVLIAKKSSCIPVSVTVVTSASATAGHAGTDQGKIANPTATVGLSGTTIKTATDVETDTADIQARIPTALTANGNMKSSLLEIITTALSEGAAGRIAAAWQGFWNIAAPVATAASANQSGDSFIRIGVAGAGLTAIGDSRLNNLDVAISVIQSQITALNNLSAKANWFGYPLLEVPDAGTRAYVFELVIKDDEDKLVNLDALPTIALTNAAGTDRSALITTGIANPSTGRYTITITVGTTTINESLKLTATGTIGAETRYASYGTQVVDYDTATLINQILTTLGVAGAGLTALGDARLANLDATVGSRLATAGYTAPPTAASNADAVWDETRSGHVTAGTFGEKVNAELDSAARVKLDATQPDYAPATVAALAAEAIKTAAIQAVTVKLDTGLVQDGAVWQFTANMLELAPAGGGGGGGGLTVDQAAQLTRIESQTAKLSGTPVTVNGNVKPGGQIVVKHGDNHTVALLNPVIVGVDDVAGSLHTIMAAVGVGNLSVAAIRGTDPASRIAGTVAALNYASNILSVTMEFTAAETAKGIVGPLYNYDVYRTNDPTRTYFSGRLTVVRDAR